MQGEEVCFKGRLQGLRHSVKRNSRIVQFGDLRQRCFGYAFSVHLEKAMAPHSSTLAWQVPWTEEPGGLQSMGSQRVGHDWATSLSLFTFMRWRRRWQPTPVFLPGESQGQGSPVARRLWGRAELHIRLKGFSSSSSNGTAAVLPGFAGGSDGKESACNAGDPGSIPGSGRSPGEGNGYPLQYSCLEIPMDRGAWQTTVHGVEKSQTWLSG